MSMRPIGLTRGRLIGCQWLPPQCLDCIHFRRDMTRRDVITPAEDFEITYRIMEAPDAYRPADLTTLPVLTGYCAAFPTDEGIPDDIWDSVADHREPYPGDHGVRFQPKPSKPTKRAKRTRSSGALVKPNKPRG